MNPLELRIGNFLTYEGQICKTNTIVLSLANAGVCLGSVLTGTEDLHFSSYESCIPIALDENWLLAFGFFEEGGIWHNGILVIASEGGSYYFKGLSGDSIISISYVHELQNLAFAINKVELKVDRMELANLL
jgi:hypothetical protein